ncbi:MAG TPA: PASTA domain-containing protein [Cytophagaceae bacterium]|jgi:beta-lactam-binding protein with PASTA domain|nr:PASTA domain-containing protein [Cytophagaceae bacterium]
MFLKANSPKDVFIHIAVIIGIFIAMILCFFFIYLPVTTNHGETITVPKLIGMNSQDLESFLNSKHLRYQINDSSYAPGTRPYTVLTQHPFDGSKVKKNRKIYITIASANPPKVKMPRLIDGSLRSAESTLKSFDLSVGKINKVPSPFPNLVLDQQMNGKTIQPGTYIPKGTKIDLTVGNGTDNEEVEVPDVTGLSLEDARTKLAESGLAVGSIRSDSKSSQPSGTVVKQNPSGNSGRVLRAGEEVSIWVAGSSNGIQ